MKRLACVLLLAIVGSGVAEVIDLGTRRELFVDRFLIEKLNDAQLRLHEPHRAGIAVKFDKPWEGGFSAYITVIKDGALYRMYYRGLPMATKDGGPEAFVCYAESKDGIAWTKPDLGLVDYGGNTRNNRVNFLPRSGSLYASLVLYEPDDPSPERRFKMMYEDYPGGSFCVAFSHDGLTWKNSPNNPVMKNTTEPSGLIHRRGLYYVVGQNRGFNKRVLVVHASPDFEHWTEANVLGFRRDNVGPLRPVIAGADATGEQVHLGAGLWDRGNVILGFYGQWHGPGPESGDRRNMTMDIGLVVSHDAMHYVEPIPDFKIIPSANENWPDPVAGTRLIQGQGFFQIGDKTVGYYSLWGPGGGEGVRMAQWTRDRLGYYSVPKAVTEGQAPFPGVEPHFISCPIRLGRPARVYVNVDGLGDHSQVRVDLLDENFQKLPGYSDSDSLPIRQSGVRRQATWRGRDTIQEVSKPIRIQVTFGGVRLEDARVYAVYLQ